MKNNNIATACAFNAVKQAWNSCILCSIQLYHLWDEIEWRLLARTFHQTSMSDLKNGQKFPETLLNLV